MTTKATKTTKHTVFTMPAKELAQRAKRGLALVRELESLFPGLVYYDEDARRHTNGRLRGGEDAAIIDLLKAAAAHSDYFKVLAAKDRGKDDKKFEIDPTLESIARRKTLADFAATLAKVATMVDDSVLEFGTQIRSVSSGVLQIAHANAAIDGGLRKSAEGALKYFAAPAAKGIATKKAKKRGQQVGK